VTIPVPSDRAAEPTPESALPAWLRTDNLAVPMLPALAHRVIELAADPEVTIPRLAAVVSKDQVLASRVLTLANSAYSAPSRTISSLNEAVVRLGTNAVRNVVITVSFTSRMHDPAIYGRHGRALVDHALGAAYMARLVADSADVDPEEAFLYGLLHDIGKLIIYKLANDHQRKTRQAIAEDELAAVIAAEHAALGGVALRRWKLPESLDAPVRFHHDYRAAPEHQREAAVAYLANRLAHRYGFGCEAEDADLLADPVCAVLGVDAAWLEAADQRAPGLFEVARQALL
jgi:putative nucleotidyltransferase with HDIG domain